MRRYGYTFLSRDEGYSLTRNFRGLVLLFGFFVVMTLHVTGEQGLELITFWAAIYILLSYFSDSFSKIFLSAIIILALGTTIFSCIVMFTPPLPREEILAQQYGYWTLCGPIFWCMYHFSIAVHAAILLRKSNRKN